MNSTGFNLPGLDDLFGGAGDDGSERVQLIPLDGIDAFPGHPFQVRDDEDMQRLADSIKAVGVQTPILVRERAGRYQLISGHRRRNAAMIAGLAEIPALVRDMTDDEATIAMVDANLQREKILPSERAWSYRMKLEAIKHQGKVSDKTSESADIVGFASGDSGRTVQRYVRLTYLIPELLKMVDEGKVGITEGVKLSYLDDSDQQRYLLRNSRPENVPPDRIVMRVPIREGTWMRYFPSGTAKQDVAQVVERALEAWFANGGNPGAS